MPAELSGSQRSPAVHHSPRSQARSCSNKHARRTLIRMRSQVQVLACGRPRHGRTREPMSNSREHEATLRRTKDVLPQPSEGQIPILPGLMQGPIPAGLVLIIEIVLVSPTTRAPKPGERSSDPAEHGRLPRLCPCDALSSLPDARTRRPAALVSSVRVATGPRSVRTASGTCGYERAGAVTTGTKKSQAAASSCP